MAVRNYSSVAVRATLTEPISGTDVTAKVDQITGWPATPFTLIIDKDKASEEAVEVTNVSFPTIAITRGIDGTPPLPHEAGAEVVHGVTGRDFREPNVHVNATSGVHGVTGDLVGTTDQQTLDRKTFTSSDGNSAPLTVRQAPGQSGNLVDLKTSTGVTVGYIDAGGKLVAPQVETTNKATFAPATSAGTAVEIRARAGQSADVLRVYSSTNEVLFSIGPGGNVYAPNLTQDSLNATNVVAQSVQTGTLSVTSSSSLGAVGATSVSVTGTVSASGANISGNISAGSVSTVGSVSATSTSAGALTASSGAFSGAVSHRGGMPIPRMAAGVASLSLTADFNGVVAITFPVGRFSVPPIVTASLRNAVAGSGSLSARVINITSSGADLYVYTGNNATTTATGVSVQWIAVQMTDSNASG